MSVASGPVRRYTRAELEAFAASRGVALATGPRQSRIPRAVVVTAPRPRDEVGEAREAFQALRYAAQNPDEVGQDVALVLARLLKDALQDAGRRAIPWVNWREAWKLWSTVVSGDHRPRRSVCSCQE